jgi:hypothetical protein
MFCIYLFRALNTSAQFLYINLYIRLSALYDSFIFLDSAKYASKAFQLFEYKYLSLKNDSVVISNVFDTLRVSLAFYYKGAS